MNIKEISEKAHNHAVKCGFYKDDSEVAIFHKVSEESEEVRLIIFHSLLYIEK